VSIIIVTHLSMVYYVLYSSSKGSIVQVLSKSNQGIARLFVRQLLKTNVI
jgi:hypothetical protein